MDKFLAVTQPLNGVYLERTCNNYTRYSFDSEKDGKEKSRFEFPLSFKSELLQAYKEYKSLPDYLKQYYLQIEDFKITDTKIEVITERCKDISILAMLEKEPDCSVGNFIDIIRSLLPAAIALCKANRIICELSTFQLFWVQNKVKFLLLRTVPTGSDIRLTHTLFENAYSPPSFRLWNWKAYEWDSTYTIGSVINYFLTLLHHVHCQMEENPKLVDLPLQWRSLVQYCEDNYEEMYYTYSQQDYICAIHNILAFMILNIEEHRPSLSYALQLFNCLFVDEDHIPVHVYPTMVHKECVLKTDVFPLLAVKEKTKMDWNDEWLLLNNNQLEDYIHLIVPRLIDERDERREYLLMMILAIFQYNKAMKVIIKNQQKEDHERYPILRLDIDDILNGSLSNDELHNLQRMLDDVAKAEKERQKLHLSSECCYYLAEQLLCFIYKTHSSAGMDLFGVSLTQAPSAIINLWTDYQKELGCLLVLKCNDIALSKIFQSILVCLPQRLSRSLIKKIVPPNKIARVLLINPILLQQVINHSDCSIEMIKDIEEFLYVNGKDLKCLIPIIINRVEIMHTRFEQLHEDILQDAITIMKILSLGLIKDPLLHNTIFYENLYQIVKDASSNYSNIRKVKELLELAIQLFQQQQQHDDNNHTLLDDIIKRLKIVCKATLIQLLKNDKNAVYLRSIVEFQD